MRTLRMFLIFLIILTFILLGFLFSEFTGYTAYEKVQVNVSRVIDGDTFESEIGKVRLLGINTPEKKQDFYEEARDYLAGFEGKEVELENMDKDKYGRILAYVYYKGRLINKEILNLGLGNLYYYEKDEKYEEMRKAEETARKQGLGIWKKSINYGCVELVKIQYKEEERCKNQEQLILENNCSMIEAELKDDATHIFNLEIEKGIFVKNFSCIWNDDRDSLYLRDNSGLLLFYRY